MTKGELTKSDVQRVKGLLIVAGGNIASLKGECKSPDPSLRSQGTRRPAQDGKTRKIKGSFAYSATKHRYTNIEKSLDRAL